MNWDGILHPLQSGPIKVNCNTIELTVLVLLLLVISSKA